jgi:hypothetical protein
MYVKGKDLQNGQCVRSLTSKIDAGWGMSSKVGWVGYTLRHDEKSAEVIEGKEDAYFPSRKGVRKRLKTKRFDKDKGNRSRVDGCGLGIESMAELGKHGAE